MHPPDEPETPPGLISLAELQQRISASVKQRGSGVSAVRVDVFLPEPFDPVQVGFSADGDPDVNTVRLDAQGEVTARVHVWPAAGSDGGDVSATTQDAVRLLRAWWGIDARDQLTTLLNARSSRAMAGVDSAVAAWVDEPHVAVAFFDIDNFKAWNDYLHHEEGDRLLRKVGAAFLRHAPSEALLLRRGGDEFVVVFPGRQHAESLLKIAELRAKVEIDMGRDESPLPGDKQVGLTAGLAFVQPGDGSYTEAEGRADTVAKPDGQKRRGRVSLHSPVGELRLATSDVVVAVALSNARAVAPFGDVWLDAISQWVRREARRDRSPSALRAAVDVVLERLSIVVGGEDRGAADNLISPEAAQPLPAVAVASAVAHGLTAACSHPPGTWRLQWLTDGSAAAITEESGEPLYMHGDPAIGPVVVLPAAAGPADECPDSHVALLLQIGAPVAPIPASLFADVVYVDDRPTMGGGLPDLWEAALAQIVLALERHPNVREVVVLGDPAMAASTLSRLRDAGRWVEGDTLYDLSTKLGQTPHMIQEASVRLDGHVKLVGGATEAISSVLEIFRAPVQLDVRNITEIAPPQPSLQRVIAQGEFVLGLRAGFRVRTAYEAFPLAIDILRQIRTMQVDELGREYVELTDFRIQLLSPLLDPIPRYRRAEADSMEEYFRREFVDVAGKFRCILEEHRQLELVVAHVVDALRSGYTTRRAQLVVPHLPQDDGPLAPLGLVSVRAIPRLLAGGPQIDYSFAWRTVECLIGLPYSLFGSIKFAEHLTDQISDAVSGGARVGEISYIAHSLHMYIDEYAHTVARLIVNDATA